MFCSKGGQKYFDYFLTSNVSADFGFLSPLKGA
jgi:hypothetical protein